MAFLKDITNLFKTPKGFDIQNLPGVFGASPESARLAGKAETLLGTAPTSVFQSPLEEALLRPQYGPTTASETELLNSLASLTQGTSALRGLGPATPSGLAQALAPTLVGLRQQNIQNLMGAEQGDIGQQLQRRGMDLSGLLELSGMAMPQTLAQPRQLSFLQQLLLGVAGGAGQAGGAAMGAKLAGACWVADELYGEESDKAMLARLYAVTNDNWFLRIYKKHGMEWAAYLHNHPWLKPVVRPVWDYMAYRGRRMLAEA